MQKHRLLVPSDLNELVEPLTTELKENFKEAKVSVEMCPDLREWGLPLPGIGSENPLNTAVGEGGGVTNFKVSALQWKNFSFKEMAEHLPGKYLIGAGAPPRSLFGVNG